MKYLTGEKEQEAKRWMAEAAEVAKKAMCLRAKCGAVIVKDGAIIGSGYNAPPLDKEEHRRCNIEYGEGKPKYDKTCCMHAEWRAIHEALKHHADKLPGSILYFTRVDESGEIVHSGKPLCTHCSRVVLDVGIKAFVLWHADGICEYPSDEFDKLSYEYVHPKS